MAILIAKQQTFHSSIIRKVYKKSVLMKTFAIVWIVYKMNSRGNCRITTQPWGEPEVTCTGKLDYINCKLQHKQKTSLPACWHKRTWPQCSKVITKSSDDSLFRCLNATIGVSDDESRKLLLFLSWLKWPVSLTLSDGSIGSEKNKHSNFTKTKTPSWYK